jgi:hypothetical protein
VSLSFRSSLPSNVRPSISGFVYRFISTGTIEEKIFQRQASKQALSSAVVDEKEDTERHFSVDALRQLFLFKENTLCETHDTFKCKRCKDGKQVTKAPALLYGDASTYVSLVLLLVQLPTAHPCLSIAGTISRMRSSRITTTTCCVQKRANQKFPSFFNTSVTSCHLSLLLGYCFWTYTGELMINCIE